MFRRPVFVAVGLIALLAPEANAFAPSDTVFIGIEPQRVRHYDDATQARLRQSGNWQEFLAGEGEGWMGRFDQLTGTPHRMWGPGIDLGPTDSRAAVEQGVLAFASRHSGLLGVDPAALRVRSASYDRPSATWYVDVDIHEQGAPIWRGGLTARIKHGKLILFGADTYPNAERVGRAALSADQAIASAIAQGPEPELLHTELSAELVWLPEEVEGSARLRLVWMTRSETQWPRGIWVGFVDASTGELVSVHNEVRYVSGTVHALHDTRTVDGNSSTSVVPLATITSSDGSFSADWFGAYETDGEATDLSTILSGSAVRVRNADGAEGELSWAGGSATWTSAEASQAEINSYVFLHHVRQWGDRVAPENGWVSARVTSNVNQNDVCNAYFDGSSVNFYKSGSGCNNTGRIADVNYHEWGHGFHYYSLQAGTYDGSLGEGAADVVAFLLTGDSVIAPYFMTGGSGIREVETDKVYPDDFVNDDWSVHSNGLIFGGAMWDLWHLLMEQEGIEEGTASTERIFVGLLKGGPDIETSYDEAIVADDNDGDLGNGTPHFCAIIEAFGAHGLGPMGAGNAAVSVAHAPLDLHPVGEDHPIAASFENNAAQCVEWIPVEASVTWRVDGGAWTSTPLTLGTVDAEGAIPQQAEGSFVEYFVSFADASGETVSAPAGEDINPFSFYVGDVIEVYCEDFEEDDGDFWHELVDGEQGLGADDWQWGIPLGEGGDPAAAYSGRFVWGNDLGDGDYNGEYQNEKTNRLYTPVLDTAHYQGSFLSYRRWLNVEDGRYDDATIYADDVEVWGNHTSPNGEEHHEDAQWSTHVVPLEGAADDGSVEIAWETASDEGLSMGGWTIDDVCVYAPATPDNRLGITDFVATDGEEGGVTLTWTNPKHAPVERVVVVRSTSAYPTTPTDGAVVFEDGAPAVDSPMSVRDDTAEGGTTYYYTVFASDGDAWLSWTLEGWNADMGSAADTGETPEPGAKGCGCNGAPAGAGAGWAALGLLALVRRRRR